MHCSKVVPTCEVTEQVVLVSIVSDASHKGRTAKRSVPATEGSELNVIVRHVFPPPLTLQITLAHGDAL